MWAGSGLLLGVEMAVVRRAERRGWRRGRAAVALVAAVVMGGVPVAPAGADAGGGVVLPPAGLVASDCAGVVPVVVGSDAAAQSDIYSAITLAGVAGTDCVILAGPRDGDMAASQQTRLEAAAAGGFVVGGTAAVPTAKLAGRDMTRLVGTDRWETAQLVGRRASGDTTAGTPTTNEDPDEGENDGETSESEEADPEEEEVTEEEGVIPDPISPNQAWIAHNIEVERIIDESGYYDTANSAYLECDNPEDTDALVQMMSDFLGCEFDNRAGLCKGYSRAAHWELESSLACPDGLLLSNGAGGIRHIYDMMCSHPDHPDFDFPG